VKKIIALAIAMTLIATMFAACAKNKEVPNISSNLLNSSSSAVSSSSSSAVIISSSNSTPASSSTVSNSSASASSTVAPIVSTTPVAVVPPVINIAVSSVDFSSRKATLNIGDKYKPVPTITPSNATDQNLKWDSSNTSVATVDQSGLVTGKSTGTAYVHATATNGQRDTFTVIVYAPVNNGGGSVTPTPTPTPTPDDTLHAPIMQSAEVINGTLSGNSAILDINSFDIQIFVDYSNVQSSYVLDDLYATVTENNNGKAMFSGLVGGVASAVSGVHTVNITPNMETYQYGSRWWLKSATYTVNVYCKKGEHSFNITAGRPDIVQVQTFTFSVYERGFQ
jgi:hypothetical protein